MLSEIIKNQIEVALQRAGLLASTEGGPEANFVVELTKDLAHGDYASNVALMLAKQTGKSPKEIAEALLPHLGNDADGYIEKVEVAGVGFLNFFVSEKYLSDLINEIKEKGDKFGRNTSMKSKKIMVEFTDPNVMKPFHIGHLMSNSIGEAIARLYESAGADVRRTNYFSDVGLAIAKAVWGMREMKAAMPAETAPVVERTDFLGKAYAFGVKQSEDPSVLEDVKEINKEIYNKTAGEAYELYQTGRRWSIEHFELLYKKLGTTFDFQIPESEVIEAGLSACRRAMDMKLFVESEGAIVYPEEKSGLHTRVFITKEGLPTYEAKDLGLPEKKFELFPFELSVSVTASEQNDYFKVVFNAAEKIFPELKGKLRHVAHGILRLPSGKMSSRTGNVITGESLIADVEEIAKAKIKEREGLTEEDKQKITEGVAVGAIKYSILKQAPGKDIIFDFDKSLSLEGDSGPYIQYSLARSLSVLRKAQAEGFKKREIKLAFGEPECKLLRLVSRLPDVTAEAGQLLAPQMVLTYLTELAGAWNSYYAANQVLVSDDPDTSTIRLAVVEALSQTIAAGLWTLAIPALAHM